MDKKKTSHTGTVLGWTLAAAIGAGLGLLFAPKSGEELREDIKDQAHKLKEKWNLNRQEIQEKVKDIFGEVSEDLEKSYISARSELMAGIEELKEKGEVTKEKFSELIEDILDGVSEKTEYPKKTLDKFKKSLKDEWDNFKENMSE